jgi:hypothetical protein
MIITDDFDYASINPVSTAPGFASKARIALSSSMPYTSIDDLLSPPPDLEHQEIVENHDLI